MKKVHIAVAFLAGCFLMSASAGADEAEKATPARTGEPVQTMPAPDRETKDAPATWHDAGREVKEAGGAVAGATQKSVGSAWEEVKNESSRAWEKTKEGAGEAVEVVGEKSKEAWKETKEGTKELWDKGKAVIHEATAPDAPPAQPAPSPASSPAAPADSPARPAPPAGQPTDGQQ